MFNSLRKIQEILFLGIIVISPLTRGGSPRWAFLIILWLAVASVSLMIIRRVWTGKSVVPRTDFDYVILIIVILSALSYIFSIHRPATLWALIRLALYISIFYITVDIAASKNKISLIVFTVQLMVLGLVIIGFLKFLNGSVPWFWIYDHGISYLTSTFRNRNHIASYLGMTLSLLLGIFIYHNKSRNFFSIIVISFGIFAFIFTLSRGAWLSFILSSCILFLLKYFNNPTILKNALKPITVLLVLLILLTLGSVSIFDRISTSIELNNDGSWQARLIVWKTTARMIKENPISGSGLGTFQWAYAKNKPPSITGRFYQTHNDYLQIFSEIGLFAFIPLIYGIIITCKTAIYKIFNSQSRFRSGLIAGSFAGVANILAHSVSDFNVQLTANGLFVCILLGLIFAAPSVSGKKSA